MNKKTISCKALFITFSIGIMSSIVSCKKDTINANNNSTIIVSGDTLNWANQQTVVIGNVAYNYIPVASGMVLTGVTTSETTLTLPSSIDGKPVISIVGIWTYNDQGFTGNANQNIQHLTIPNSFTSIGNFAFWGWDALQSVALPNSITTIGNSAFMACLSLTTINLPNNIQNIGENVFADCKKLSNNTLPTNLKVISRGLFYNCQSLSAIVIPNQVTKIGNGAFFYIGNISIPIPNSIKVIEDDAFYTRNGVSINIKMEATTPPIIGNSVFDMQGSSSSNKVINTNATIQVPSASVNTYKTANGWSRYANQITGY